MRFVNNRHKAELNLEVRTTQQELDDALLVLDHPRLKADLKPKLLYFSKRIKEYGDKLILDKGANVDVKTLRDYIGRALGLIETEEQPATIGFAKHFQSFIEGKSNKRTKDIYSQTLKHIRDFDSNIEKKKFEDIDLKWLTDFEAFCAKTSSKNARNIHLRNIRAVFNNAIDFEITTAYPFRRFKIRPEATRKRSLSYDNIRKVFYAEGIEDWEQKYLDFFRLSFMLIGINVIDLCNLNEINEGRIYYVRAKTHKPYSIRVEPEAMELIEKYRGQKHLLNFTDNYDNYRHFYNNLTKGLKSIKGKLGISELTTYWARHTWATVAASLDIPKETIAAALGHGGHTVTDIYIDFDKRKIDEANRRVLDWVLYEKR